MVIIAIYIILALNILKLEFIIKKEIVTNHAFFAVVTFSRIIFFDYINSIVLQLTMSNLQKDFHHDNLSFVCLQFYEQNYLNILADNISCRKESIEMTVKY